MKDMNGREIKLNDVFCSPSDCDGYQVIGVVTKLAPETVIGITLHNGEYSHSLYSESYYEPTDIKVLCSIEDTRAPKQEKANVAV